MSTQRDEDLKDKKIVIPWLAHHNPKRDDFNTHVFYLFNHAICIGCSAFILGTTLALILGNVFYNYIVTFFSLPVIIAFFLFCWLPSIFQYLIQIFLKKPLTNRAIKFIIRFLYPIGSIIFIFKSTLWGFLIAVPAGYLILYIRKKKVKILES